MSRASLSAYGMEDYEEALRLGRAGYEAFSEVNHRWGKIAALCRIGFAALALGDVGEAQRTFRAALERAHASAAISLELLALSGVGAVLREGRARAGGDGAHVRARSRAAPSLVQLRGAPGAPRLSRPSYLPSSSPPPGAAAATSLDDLVDQALAVTAPK